MAKRITLKDVAERVGVTSAAASMALSGHERISERTRVAVERAAADLGYVPSNAGRALRSQRAGAIALIVPNTSQHVFGHLYFMHVLTGVSEAANAHDSRLIVSTNAEDAGGVVAYERVMRSRTADGAIVTSAAVDDTNVQGLVASGLPVVLIGNFPYLPDAVSVGIDDVAATERITRHLIEEHGRGDLVHVTGTLDHQTGIDRREGFLRAVRDLGARGTVVEGDLSEESGVAAARHILDSAGTDNGSAGTGRGRTGTGTPDGIVFANDDMALGGMRTLQAAGVRVPDDIAVVGFDDFGLARVTSPGITTIAVPAEEMARIAAERLFDLVDDHAEGPAHIELPVDLVLRGSCGCPGHH